MDAKAAFLALYRNLLWIGPLLFCISGLTLALCIRGVIRSVREAVLFSVPLVERQTIEFLEAGRVMLCVEGPRFTTRFARLKYELSADSGAPVEGRVVLFRFQKSSFSRVRLEVRTYEIPRPGSYVLRIQGLGPPQARDTEHQLVFTRPHTARSVSYILGIVFSGLVLILSLIFFLMRLVGVGSEP
ncbi:MAG: hypothetical protein LAN62_13610 [Acidobacteriia bacterium]|nr:hypothetical protein [Terriglobia bacterium]